MHNKFCILENRLEKAKAVSVLDSKSLPCMVEALSIDPEGIDLIPPEVKTC